MEYRHFIARPIQRAFQGRFCVRNFTAGKQPLPYPPIPIKAFLGSYRYLVVLSNSTPVQLNDTDYYVYIDNRSGGALIINLPLHPKDQQAIVVVDYPGNAGTYPWVLRDPNLNVQVDTIMVNNGWTAQHFVESGWIQTQPPGVVV